MDNIIDMRALLDGVEPLTLSLWMCAILLLLVLIGVRVAFAAAFVGIVGLCLYFMQRQGFDRGPRDRAEDSQARCRIRNQAVRRCR
jgi:C4-dicarboxylate transporter DctM subunit